jgi:hypothetical protein
MKDTLLDFLYAVAFIAITIYLLSSVSIVLGKGWTEAAWGWKLGATLLAGGTMAAILYVLWQVITGIGSELREWVCRLECGRACKALVTLWNRVVDG